MVSLALNTGLKNCCIIFSGFCRTKYYTSKGAWKEIVPKSATQSSAENFLMVNAISGRWVGIRITFKWRLNYHMSLCKAFFVWNCVNFFAQLCCRAHRVTPTLRSQTGTSFVAKLCRHSAASSLDLCKSLCSSICMLHSCGSLGPLDMTVEPVLLREPGWHLTQIQCCNFPPPRGENLEVTWPRLWQSNQLHLVSEEAVALQCCCVSHLCSELLCFWGDSLLQWCLPGLWFVLPLSMFKKTNNSVQHRYFKEKRMIKEACNWTSCWTAGGCGSCQPLWSVLLSFFSRKENVLMAACGRGECYPFRPGITFEWVSQPISFRHCQRIPRISFSFLLHSLALSLLSL